MTLVSLRNISLFMFNKLEVRSTTQTVIHLENMYHNTKGILKWIEIYTNGEEEQG